MMKSKRELLLQAAAEVALQSGAGAMTLEAVAAQAGVSKGGLLYHFASKDALIEAMIALLVSSFESAIEAEISRDLQPLAGRFLRAYVRVSTAPQDDSDALAHSLMAAVTINHRLLGAMREADARWQKRAENDGLPADLATIVRLAADGCWLSALFGFDAGLESQAERRAVRNRLLEILAEATQTEENR